MCERIGADSTVEQEHLGKLILDIGRGDAVARMVQTDLGPWTAKFGLALESIDTIFTFVE